MPCALLRLQKQHAVTARRAAYSPDPDGAPCYVQRNPGMILVFFLVVRVLSCQIDTGVFFTPGIYTGNPSFSAAFLQYYRSAFRLH